MATNLKRFLRVGISIGLLAFVYSAVDLKSLGETLRTLPAITAFVLIGLYAFGQLVSALKWHIFVQQVGIHRPIRELIRSYFFGMFVNTFGLGTVGGDVTRSLLLRPEKGKRAAALATVVADRAHGLAVLLSIGAVAILFVEPSALGPFAFSAAVVVIPALLLGWFLGPKLLLRFFQEGHRYSNAAKLAATAFPATGKPVIQATLISVFFHCVQIIMHFIILRELGAPIQLSYLFATVPLINVASSLPISMNGLGIREALYIFLFVPVGVSEEIAVALGAIWIVTVTIVSAVGGLMLSPVEKQTSQEILEHSKSVKLAQS